MFRKSLLKSAGLTRNHVYKTHDSLGLKLLTKLRLGLSHLDEHRFNHNFDSCVNPLCSSSLKVESPKKVFLHCRHYTNICKTLLNTVEIIDEKFFITF